MKRRTVKGRTEAETPGKAEIQVIEKKQVTSVAFWNYVYFYAEWQALVAPGFSPACAALKGGATVNAFAERNTRSTAVTDAFFAKPLAKRLYL